MIRLNNSRTQPSKTRIKMRSKRVTPLVIFSSLIVGGGLLIGFTPLYGQFASWQISERPINLQVPALAQSETTSCGEAAIVMAYNYVYPESPISERQVIDYAAEQGYFTEDLPPFTSPANMVRIARHYTPSIESGNVVTSNQGLALLNQKLQDGEPVIIDVLTYLDDPTSSAHFVLVTGITVDPARENAIVIHYNNPLTGKNESADWAGDAGVWHAWQNNGDPNGHGWWLVISLP
jgi:hypothetical protein